MSPDDQIQTARLANDLGNVVVFLALGLAGLWIAAVSGGHVLETIRPVLVFLFIAGLIGAVIYHLLFS